MSTALLAQQPVTRSFPLGNAGVYGPGEMNGFTAYQTAEVAVPKSLEDGAMVVMYAAPGELIIVRPNGKYWDLEAISTTEETEELTLQFFPSVSIFTVVRKGKFVGFKSLAAEGRTLQAVAADDNVPLRVNNYNFGPWESWEATGSGYINKKWPQRSLTLEVREIQAVSVEDLRRLERHNLKMSRDKQKQIKTLELKHQEIKRQLQEQSRARKRMTIQHQRELEDSRSRLEEALRAKQRLEVDAVQTGARLKQKELQFQQLILQRDTAEAALEQKEANQRAHEREIELLKEKHSNDLDGLKRHHRNEMEAMKRDVEYEVGRSTKGASGEAAIVQQKLETALEDKERELRRVCIEHQHSVQQKVNEINNLRDENQRLTMALHTIREQLTRGFVAINSSEMAPSRAGTERSLDLQGSSFHRYSPAPSRASTGRRPEDTNDGSQYNFERMGVPSETSITPRRGSVPCAPSSPYGRMSPAHSPEPFGLRSPGEYRHPRRGDSRLSDNTGLGRIVDEVPPPYRRMGGGFGRSHRHIDPLHSRYSSQLDSVEDSMNKDGSEYQDEVSEREEVGTRQNEDLASEIEEKEAKKDTAPDSDGISVSSEDVLPVEETNKADPTDALLSSDDDGASDTPQSWVREVAPNGHAQLQSGSVVESDKDSKPDEE